MQSESLNIKFPKFNRALQYTGRDLLLTQLKVKEQKWSEKSKNTREETRGEMIGRHGV